RQRRERRFPHEVTALRNRDVPVGVYIPNGGILYPQKSRYYREYEKNDTRYLRLINSNVLLSRLHIRRDRVPPVSRENGKSEGPFETMSGRPAKSVDDRNVSQQAVQRSVRPQHQ